MKTPFARTIVTPSDLRDVLEVTDGSRWTSLVGWDPAREPEVRAALEAILEPQRTRRFHGDRAGLSAYLESVTGPLAFLREGGVAIVAIVAPGATLGMRAFPLTPDWALYLVGVPGLYVRCEGDATVHGFGPECGAFVASFVRTSREGLSFTSWATRADVAAALGAAVPWCTQCCLAEAAGLDDGMEA
jgi:hypothetical protein